MCIRQWCPTYIKISHLVVAWKWSFRFDWYWYAISIQWYQFYIKDAWWLSLSTCITFYGTWWYLIGLSKCQLSNPDKYGQINLTNPQKLLQNGNKKNYAKIVYMFHKIYGILLENSRGILSHSKTTYWQNIFGFAVLGVYLPQGWAGWGDIILGNIHSGENFSVGRINGTCGPFY